MDIKYISPFGLSGFRGIISFIFSLIMFSALQNNECPQNDILIFLCSSLNVTNFTNSTFDNFTEFYYRINCNPPYVLLYTIFGSLLCSTMFNTFIFLTYKQLLYSNY